MNLLQTAPALELEEVSQLVEDGDSRAGIR